MNNCGVYVAKSRIAGLGVFAGRSFKKGELLEQAPILKLVQPDQVLEDYVFSENRLCLGYGAVYNHSDEPNVRQRCDQMTCTFTALTDIQHDQELCIDYGTQWWKAKGRIPLTSRPRLDGHR